MNKLKSLAFATFVIATILMDGISTVQSIREHSNQPRVVHVDTTRRVERPIDIDNSTHVDSIERPPNWRDDLQCIPNTDLNGDGQDDFCAKDGGGHP